MGRIDKKEGLSISVSTRPPKDGKRPQLNIIVSKKDHPLATDRNLIKRRIRAAIKKNYNSNKYNLFVYTKKNFLKKKYIDIVSELKHILPK